MHLTADMLRAKGACGDQVDTFEAEWPEGHEVSEATILRSYELDLDVEWFAEHFLQPPALAEYEKARAAALAAAIANQEKELAHA